MWDDQWADLTAEHDVVRLDLRGFGDSTSRPAATIAHVDDVASMLDELGVERCHVVGASLGAGVAVELALAHPDRVASLILAPPGGSLLREMTPHLREFVDAERTALAANDIDAAVEANLAWWVDGPVQDPTRVDPQLRERVRVMQRRAFELTLDWDDLYEDEPNPPALERLGELRIPTLVLVGGLDLDASRDAARNLVGRVPGALSVEWPGAAHLPSMERPADFLSLVLDWVRSHGLVTRRPGRRSITSFSHPTGSTST